MKWHYDEDGNWRAWRYFPCGASHYREAQQQYLRIRYLRGGRYQACLMRPDGNVREYISEVSGSEYSTVEEAQEQAIAWLVTRRLEHGTK